MSEGSPDVSRRRFTPVGLGVVILVVGLLLCLLFPAVNHLREEARRKQCIDNLKMLDLGVQSFQAAHRAFPGSNDVRLLETPSNSWIGVPLHTPAEPDPSVGPAVHGTNYSWLIKILFFLEHPNVVHYLPKMAHRRAWDLCADNPIDPATGLGKDTALPCNPMYWRTPIGYFECPSMGEPQFCEANPTGGVTTNPYDPQTPFGPAGRTNYVALGATHSDSLLGVETDPLAGGPSHPNGVIYPGSKTKLADIADGAANTLLLCETREKTLAAWWEGSTAAVFGLVGRPTFTAQTSPSGATYGVPGNETATTLNYGDEQSRPITYYLNPGPQGIPWVHGPSSFHPGVVNHGLADGSVRSVSEEIDPRLYMHLITRAGGEPVNTFFAD